MVFSINNQTSINQVPTSTEFINTILPQDMLNEIFSYLGIQDLNACSQVCSNWKAEIEDPEKSKIRMYKHIAFTPEDWRKYFGNDILSDLETNVARLLLPLNIYQILKGPSRAFSGKKVSETHMLVWIPKNIDGKPLTLNSFGELVKKYFPQSKTGYSTIWDGIGNQEGIKPIKNSGWVLMTNDLLPGSIDKCYPLQQAIVTYFAKKTLIDYEVPTALKASICILSNYIKTGKRVFNDYPDAYTRCQERFNGLQLMVGGFDSTGLSIIVNSDSYNIFYEFGVAGMRNLDMTGY